jgi:hypothetical protein
MHALIIRQPAKYPVFSTNPDGGAATAPSEINILGLPSVLSLSPALIESLMAGSLAKYH